jgi:hypothetical protein
MFDELIDGFVGHQLEDVVGSREYIVEPDIKYRILIYFLSKSQAYQNSLSFLANPGK